MKKTFSIAVLLLALCFGMALAQTNKITPSGFMNADLVRVIYDTQNQNEAMCFNSGALGNATEDVAITAAVNYVKSGLFGQIATGEIRLSGATQEVSTTKLYIFTYNTSTSTTEVTVGAAGETDLNDITLPSGNIPFGYMKIVTDSTHEFVPGTTAMTATGITETYYNLAIIPSRVRVYLTND